MLIVHLFKFLLFRFSYKIIKKYHFFIIPSLIMIFICYLNYKKIKNIVS